MILSQPLFRFALAQFLQSSTQITKDKYLPITGIDTQLVLVGKLPFFTLQPQHTTC